MSTTDERVTVHTTSDTARKRLADELRLIADAVESCRMLWVSGGMLCDRLDRATPGHELRITSDLVLKQAPLAS